MADTNLREAEKFGALVPCESNEAREARQAQEWAEKFRKFWNLMDSPNEGEAQNAFKKVRATLSEIGVGFSGILQRAEQLDEAVVANAELGEQNRLLKRENGELRAVAQRYDLRRMFSETGRKWGKRIATETFCAALAAPAAGSMMGCWDVSVTPVATSMGLAGAGLFRLMIPSRRSATLHLVSLAWFGTGMFLCINTVNKIAQDEGAVKDATKSKIEEMDRAKDFGPVLIRIDHRYAKTTTLVSIKGERQSLSYRIEGDMENRPQEIYCDRYWTSSIDIAKESKEPMPAPPDTTGPFYASYGNCDLYRQLKP